MINELLRVARDSELIDGKSKFIGVLLKKPNGRKQLLSFNFYKLKDSRDKDFIIILTPENIKK